MYGEKKLFWFLRSGISVNLIFAKIPASLLFFYDSANEVYLCASSIYLKTNGLNASVHAIKKNKTVFVKGGAIMFDRDELTKTHGIGDMSYDDFIELQKKSLPTLKHSLESIYSEKPIKVQN